LEIIIGSQRVFSFVNALGNSFAAGRAVGPQIEEQDVETCLNQMGGDHGGLTAGAICGNAVDED